MFFNTTQKIQKEPRRLYVLLWGCIVFGFVPLLFDTLPETKGNVYCSILLQYTKCVVTTVNEQEFVVGRCLVSTSLTLYPVVYVVFVQ